MTKGYGTILHRWFDEVWNEKREEAIDEMLSENAVHHGLGGIEDVSIRGIGAFKEFYRAFISAFPDLQVTVEEVITDGEKLAGRYVAHGTHIGDGLGFAPTNREVKFTGMGICIIREGKFVEIWNEVDFLKLYSQLGVLPLELK